MAQYAVETPPPSDDLSAILNAGGQMLDNLKALYVRMCGRLAATDGGRRDGPGVAAAAGARLAPASSPGRAPRGRGG